MRKGFDVIVIGGTGVQTKAYPTISLVGKWFVDNGISTHFVDGASRIGSRLVALTPNDQSKIIIEALQNQKKSNDAHTLYLTHCLGMAAAVKVMGSIKHSSTLLALSPPLPSPLKTIQTDHSRKNIMTKNGVDYIPGYSWSDPPFQPSKTAARIDVELRTTQRLEELRQDEDHFMKSVKTLDEEDRLKLIIARRDWNRQSVQHAKNFKDTLELDVTHALIGPDVPKCKSSPTDMILAFTLKHLAQLELSLPPQAHAVLENR